MVGLLNRLVLICAPALFAAQVAAAELSDRHELKIALDWNLTETTSGLGAWPDGGFGKLRHDSSGSDYGWTRLALDYKGHITPTLFGRVVMDVINDAIDTAGPTEAYLEWRPLPSGLIRNRLRFGAFYPAFSMENSGFAWESLQLFEDEVWPHIKDF